MSIEITWLGHSAFKIEIDDHQVLVDPFLSNNPLAAARPGELNPEVILLSHGHGDHVGDTVDIAKRTNATVISNVEISNWIARNGIETAVGINVGGTWRGDFMDARLTIAHHSSSLPDGSYGGQPNGIVIFANGMKLYFAGDTDVFLEMQLIGEMGIDLAFLPIGDFYTMGPEGAVRAIQFVKPKVVIPMHYNTFPPIMQDASEWANRVNSVTDAQPVVLDPGGSYTLGK
jgi:L-ascorbate metabolism protein UlaG (beta-lactamase superfamily)